MKKHRTMFGVTRLGLNAFRAQSDSIFINIDEYNVAREQRPEWPRNKHAPFIVELAFAERFRQQAFCLLGYTFGRKYLFKIVGLLKKPNNALSAHKLRKHYSALSV